MGGLAMKKKKKKKKKMMMMMSVERERGWEGEECIVGDVDVGYL